LGRIIAVRLAFTWRCLQMVENCCKPEEGSSFPDKAKNAVQWFI